MSGFRIRPTTEADFDGIAEGFATATDRDPADVHDIVVHGLGANPYGFAGVVAEDANRRIVAHLGVSLLPVRLNDRDRSFGRFLACFLDETYRIGGVHSPFFELQETFREVVEDQRDVALVAGLFDEADWWFLRYLCGFRAVGTGVCYVREPGPWTSGEWSAPVVEGGDVGSVEWSEPLLTGEIAVVRDRAFSDFRATGPWGNDRRFVVTDADGSGVSGLATVRRRGLMDHVADWAVVDGDETAAKSLMRAVVGDGDRRIKLRIWNPSVWTCHVLYETGFRVARHDEPFLAARWRGGGIKRHGLSVHWQVTSADVGFESQPRMTVDEQVVRPPQPGTVSGRSLRGAVH